MIVIGSGQEEKLKRLAGPTVTFLGWQPDEAIRAHLRRLPGPVISGREDFGIVPVEAMACGTPVIAYAGRSDGDVTPPAGHRGAPTVPVV